MTGNKKNCHASDAMPSWLIDLVRSLIVIGMIAFAVYWFGDDGNRQKFAAAVNACDSFLWPKVEKLLGMMSRNASPSPVVIAPDAHPDSLSEAQRHSQAVRNRDVAPPPPQFEVPLPTSDQLAAAGLPEAPPFYIPPPTKKSLKRKGVSAAIRFEKKKLHGVSFYQTTIDLADPQTYMSIALPHGALEANSSFVTYGDETFDSFVKRCHGAVLMNGTFFSKDAEKRVMGNLVSEGRFLKYSRWENYGTTLGIKEGNQLEMVTARAEGQPRWDDHWFSLTCGPRLLRKGEVWVYPEIEGFTDSHVLTVGPRQAIGYSRTRDKIYLVTFLSGLSLKQEAEMMKGIGCYEAMNLDGGASRALAHDGNIIVKAGRPLTNVLVVYDKAHPAPPNVVDSWAHFQNGEHPNIPTN